MGAGLREASLARDPWPAYSSRLYTERGNAAMSRPFARLAGRVAANEVRTVRGYERWSLAYTIGGAGRSWTRSRGGRKPDAGSGWAR